jgi:hypothetical protein
MMQVLAESRLEVQGKVLYSDIVSHIVVEDSGDSIESACRNHGLRQDPLK